MCVCVYICLTLCVRRPLEITTRNLRERVGICQQTVVVGLTRWTRPSPCPRCASPPWVCGRSARKQKEVTQGVPQTPKLQPNLVACDLVSAAKLVGLWGPFSVGFCPIDLKPFWGRPGPKFLPGKHSGIWEQSQGSDPLAKKVNSAISGVCLTPCIRRPLEESTRNLRGWMEMGWQQVVVGSATWTRPSPCPRCASPPWVLIRLA
jgi:hypothetical protein